MFFKYVTIFAMSVLLMACSDTVRRQNSPLPKALGSTKKLPAPGRNYEALKPVKSDWPSFGRDGTRQQNSPLTFQSANFKLIWKYDLGNHTFEYREGTNVWSESAVALTHKGLCRIILGAYDHKVHCLNASNGELLWRFTTGDQVVATVVASTEMTTPTILVASTDRSVYGLDLNGKRLWVRETMAWAHTVAPSIAASPALMKIDGDIHAAGAYYINDFGRSSRRQDGYAVLWNLASGKEKWSVLLRHDHIFGPAIGTVNKIPILFYATGDGTVAALDGRSGTLAWSFVTDERLRSCPTFVNSKEGPTVLVTTRWGMLWSLDARTGKTRFSYRSGHMSDSSVAVLKLKSGKQMAFFGSYDRCIHAIDLNSGKRQWKFKTGSVIVSSPAIARINNRPVLFFSSLDDYLYCIDCESGKKLWSFKTGSLPWAYFKRGDAVFSSPIVCATSSDPILVFPGHDGTVYAFRATENKNI